MIKVSSNLDRRTIRPTGGLVAAVRRPWYRRVLAPVMEALEKAADAVCLQPLPMQCSFQIAADVLFQFDHDSTFRETALVNQFRK